MSKSVTIGSLIVNVLARTTGFDLSKPRKELADFQATAAGMSGAFKGIGAAIGAVGAAIGASKMLSDIRSVTDALGNLNDFAGRIGIATDKLIGLQYGAQFVGVSAEQTNAALNTMTRQIGEAIHGGGKAKDVFKAMGVSVGELARMKPEAAFMRIADGIRSLTSEEDQLRASMRIFGGDGAAMLNFLREGSQGISNFVREAKTIGASIGAEDIDKVDRLGDAMDKLGATWQGIKNAIVIDIAPEAVAAVEALQEAMIGAKLIAGKTPTGDREGWLKWSRRMFLSGGGPASFMGGAIPKELMDALDKNLTSILDNEVQMAGIGLRAPAFGPGEVKQYTRAGVEATPEYSAAKKAFEDVWTQWKASGGKLGDMLGPLSKAQNDLFNESINASFDAKRSPASNMWIIKAGERYASAGIDKLFNGLKVAGEFLEKNKDIGKKAYYESLMQSIWPTTKDNAKNQGRPGLNQALDATSAEGYTALRANLKSNETVKQLQKQTTLLDAIAKNTAKFTVQVAGL